MKINQNQTKHNFRGAVPLLRKFQQHPFWTERRKYSRAEAWIDLLFMARYGAETEEIWDREELIPIKYAQILTSVITLAHKWKRSRGWTKNFIKILEKKQSISVITMNNRRTILQIVNMGNIKQMLQGNEQHSLQQKIQQKDSGKTHKNKVNTVNKEITNTVPASQEIKKSFNEEIHVLVGYLAHKLGCTFPNYGKQAKYTKLMLVSPYSVDDIKWAIDVMSKDKWWSEHSFDMKNVADQIPKLMTTTFKGGDNHG